MTARRRFLVLATSLAWVPLRSYAQQRPRMPRIGLLSPFSAAATAEWYDALKQGLRELGWIEGKTIAIEYRYADGRHERLPDLAAELVRLNVSVIVTSVTPDAIAAKKATRNIPIVMASIGDPVASGLVESLARPGGNVTGLSQMGPEMGGKRLELLRDVVPKLSRVAVMWNPNGPGSRLNWEEIQAPARRLALQLHSLEVRSAGDFDRAFDELTRARAGALLVLPDTLFVTHLSRIAQLSARHHVPAVFHLSEFAEAGGLAAYGPDRADLFRRAAAFVDKILRGTKPGELPVEQATKFELVVNLKTARALGLSIPQSLLLRADKVIQ